MARAKDMAGQTFGRLQVVERAPDKWNLVMWLCRCSCSRETTVSGVSLRSGHVKSCGCFRTEKSAARARALVEDLTGRIFSWLTVVERAANRGPNVTWFCRCVCGQMTRVATCHLTAGIICSCGCSVAKGATLRPAHIRRQANESLKRRRANNASLALRERVQTLLRNSLKHRGIKKSRRTEELLGYTLAELERRLHRTVPKGYTWTDFLSGELHIEHKIPLAAFNITDENCIDFRRAWALLNLQLMPGRDNRRKGARLDAPFQPSLGF